MARRFDIHIQALPEAEQRATYKFMSFGGASTLGVKGFQMLVNQWLKCYLTRRGSDPADLNYGTVFTSLVGSSIPLEDARDVVVLAIDQCNEQVFADNALELDLTLTERLAAAQLTDFTEQPTAPGFDMTVEIQNQAGERLAFSLPDFTAVS